jgi:hypothetical protein
VPEAYSDENFDGVYNPFARPPTSEALLVTASDRNLNRLASAATYAVTKPDNTDFLISYNGEPQLPDGHGFWFGLRACNTAAIPTCALDCADVALADGRCTLESVIQDYSYGYVASVTLSGGPADSYDGATQAFWEVTLAPWKLDLSVSGTHQ